VEYLYQAVSSLKPIAHSLAVKERGARWAPLAEKPTAVFELDAA
jgi:hypothetical protein